MATVVNAALANAGIAATDVTAADDSGTVKLTTVATGTSAKLAITGAASSDNGNFDNLVDIDITDATDAQLSSYTNLVESMSQKVTTAAANLGSVKSRIDMQTDFVKNLMDAVDRGVGALVDADMSEESTRLQALQTQQQLGIQALSIANSNSQSILSLFR
jgi:flagellin